MISRKQPINIPYDFYHDPRSISRQAIDKKTDYRTYSMLALPLLDKRGQTVAVVQLLNKLNPIIDPGEPLIEQIDRKGFTRRRRKIVSRICPVNSIDHGIFALVL